MGDFEQIEQLSDDEVFIGKLSLKEIKKRVLWNKQREVLGYSDEKLEDNQNMSLKIIEAHSEPNLIKTNTEYPQLKAVSNPHLTPNMAHISWDVKPTDDSFLRIEQMVSDLCVSKDKSVELDNTLDVIDYILNNGPSQTYEKCDNDLTIKCEEQVTVKPSTEAVVLNEKQISPVKKVEATCNTPTLVTPAKIKYETPSSDMKTRIKYETPSSGTKTRTVFKTPLNPVSRKTPVSSMKKTPSRTKNYEHIASPVASYIKNCPIAPLVKDVRPTKPLPGPSFIPKFVKETHNKVENKENVNLPNIAYKSAKKTKVIDVPSGDKLPKSPWAKKITSSLPRPLVMKHDHREHNFAKRTLLSKQEDSYADLSLQQAEISVCTQKSAINLPKRHL